MRSGTRWLRSLLQSEIRAERAFVVVLVKSTELADTPLGPFGHLGLACASKTEVDRMAAMADAQGILRSPPTDSGHPVGYWTYISDPDGNTLELSYGQQIRFAAETASRT
ncbi:MULTISPECIES: hypothetical protein [unclassified Brevundimonas]|uniref:hypothetical protein n=1 Tax=unclassified Brevundimonas TaxID=2622653 RepID=UPI000CFC9E29|nr:MULTISPECIES: hypothetical protein [unclassified Brevundimonas]